MNQSQQRPALITWIGYLAITLLIALPLAVLIVRSGAWQQGLLLYAICCLGATALLALCVLLLMLPRYSAWRGAILRRAALALPGTLLLSTLLAGSGDHPRIHDITTDTADPPIFTAAVQRRGTRANSLEIRQDTLEQQREAYPDLNTLLTNAPIDDAFDRALQVATALGWEVYHQDRNAASSKRSIQRLSCAFRTISSYAYAAMPAAPWSICAPCPAWVLAISAPMPPAFAPS